MIGQFVGIATCLRREISNFEKEEKYFNIPCKHKFVWTKNAFLHRYGPTVTLRMYTGYTAFIILDFFILQLNTTTTHIHTYLYVMYLSIHDVKETSENRDLCFVLNVYCTKLKIQQTRMSSYPGLPK